MKSFANGGRVVGRSLEARKIEAGLNEVVGSRLNPLI